MTPTDPLVTIGIVTHDSARDLPACLEAVRTLSYRPLELVVVDCASSDRSVDIAHQALLQDGTQRIISLDENLGFAGGMNKMLEAARGRFVLSLNPDTLPERDFVDRLVARALPTEKRLGAVTGRLTRIEPRGESRVLDACGMILTPTWRHLDRGSGQIDQGQWEHPERVFGGTGAATLFCRQALDDVALDGQIFDPDFHSFREDAELCFRLRERGWEILYEPTARCRHRRRNLPERRSEMPAEVNFHSLKNRYLLRAYHQDWANLVLTLVPSLLRDLLALGYVLTRERPSLGAYSWLWNHRRHILARRRRIQERRLCGWWELNRWFFRRSLPFGDA